MGCLSVHTERRDSLGILTERRDPMVMAAEERPLLAVVAERRDGMTMSTSRRDALRIMVSVVCEASDAYYLYVAPKEVQWITPDEGAVYDVQSNTTWEIE